MHSSSSARARSSLPSPNRPKDFLMSKFSQTAFRTCFRMWWVTCSHQSGSPPAERPRTRGGGGRATTHIRVGTRTRTRRRLSLPAMPVSQHAVTSFRPGALDWQTGCQWTFAFHVLPMPLCECPLTALPQTGSRDACSRAGLAPVAGAHGAD